MAPRDVGYKTWEVKPHCRGRVSQFWFQKFRSPLLSNLIFLLHADFCLARGIGDVPTESIFDGCKGKRNESTHEPVTGVRACLDHLRVMAS